MATDSFISQEEAKQFLSLGFNMDEWEGSIFYEIIQGTERDVWDEEECQWSTIMNINKYPKLRIDQAAKWLREQLGADLVVSPRFDSETGGRKGYFVRWAQRTDLRIDKATYRTYEAAMSYGISKSLESMNGGQK